jgi:hypothetical protein
LFFFGWIRYIDSYKEISQNSDVQLLGENSSTQQKREHWKHFRILPLTWLSWNPESDQKVSFWFACCLWYDDKIDEKTVKYTAFFPLFLPIYGYGQNDKDYTKFVFFNFYIESYTEEDHNLEKSYFWPFSKFYQSDKESGSYIFPFYAYKKEINENQKVENTSHWVFLYYQSRKKQENSTEDFTFFFPIYFSYIKNNNGDEKGHRIVLLFYQSIDTKFYREKKPSVNKSAEQDSTKNEKKNLSQEVYKESYKPFITFFPIFFLWREANFNQDTKQFEVNTTHFNFMLLFNWSNEIKYNEQEKHYTTNLDYLVLFPFVWTKYMNDEKDRKEIFFTIFPLVWTNYEWTYYKQKDYIKKDDKYFTKYFTIWPIIGISNNCEWGHWLHFIYLCPSEGYYQNFPFFWYNQKDYLTIFPLLTIDWEKGQFNGMIIYPLLGYYRNKDDFNFLFYLLAHRYYNNLNDYSYNFTPLFWVHQSPNSYTNIFLPFYYYSESYNEKNLYVSLLLDGDLKIHPKPFIAI